MPTSWQEIVDQMTDVQKLVHLAMRMTADDEDRLRSEILRERRKFYEAELTTQAKKVGCGRRTGRLPEGPILSELNEMSSSDAESIVNTYNRDIAGQIIQIYQNNPRSNRNMYASKLTDWDKKRSEWKNPQILQVNEMTARSKAQQNFYTYNSEVIGTAELTPTQAVCPVCIGWVARGTVPLRVAEKNPPPYHINCPHTWDTNPEKIDSSMCSELWMGE